MWQKLKEQLPVILITAALVVGAAYWLNLRTVKEMDDLQQAKMAEQRQQFDGQIKASNEVTRRQIEAVDKVLKDAIQKRSADVFMTDDEVAKLNAEKVNQLAEAIAKKVQPYNPLPKTPEEAEKMQNEQVDKVSSRMVVKITPILNEMASDQQLNSTVLQTEAAADDALKLNHELTALYLSSKDNEGIITRLLMLPSNVVKDAANLSIVTSGDRAKIEQDLVNKENAIEKRLADIRAQAPKS